MERNMGNIDKIARIILALVALILFATGFLTGTVAMLFLIIGGIFLATALIGFCPFYSLFGIHTTSKTKK